jgi:PBSX family phage terminase large subunit
MAATRTPKARRHVIVEGDPAGPTLRGGALELWRSDDHECLIAGPAETGKTYAVLLKLDALMSATPDAQAVIVRKVRDTIYSTVLQTYMRKVQRFAENEDVSPAGVRRYGGERPQWFDYPKGGRLWLAGIDDPGKALSSERDFIVTNQTEELSADDWEVLTSRVTGRAGNTAVPQIFGDCNPGPPHHWIKNRPRLRVLGSRHEDNPTLWNERAQQWTEQGKRTLATLDALTGVRKQRLRYGRWVAAEGTVYEESFDPALHVIDPFPVPAGWTRFRSIDFGFTNPFCCGWWALDPDGRLYLYREIYMTRRTVRVHRRRINDLSAGERFDATAADHDAEDRATLEESDKESPPIHTVPAEKAISVGIQAVEERLKVQPDGRPRLFIMRGCLVERDEALAEAKLPVCTEQEFDVYAWPKGADGRAVKEKPVDLHNHGMDMMRYAVRWADVRCQSTGRGARVGPRLADRWRPAGGGRG